MSSHSSEIRISFFEGLLLLKGEYSQPGKRKSFDSWNRLRKSNGCAAPPPHPTSAAQDRGYLQGTSQDMSAQERASGFSFLHVSF